MDRQKLAESLLTFVPAVFKRLMKCFPAGEISRQQFELLFRIHCEDERPMSYYSEKLMISKPNLTVAADKLIEDGLVERLYDAGDRRVIILKITQKGQELLHEHREKVRDEMIRRLELFDDSDVKRLNELIDEMRSIFDKLDQA